MIGQQMMVMMNGTVPDERLLGRIRDGQVGGVILYAENITSPDQTKALVAQLQGAAKAGGNPPLLISTDQEGGEVKRLRWAAPTLSAAEMGAQGGAVAAAQGEQTGQALRAVGINVDLAPVVDVAHSSEEFIWKQDRAFGMTADAVINAAIPFAAGLERADVAPTAKHFPGLGGVANATDYSLESVMSEPEDLSPYKPLIARHIPLIMVGVAAYPNLDPSGTPAALSHTIITGLLRQRLGYDGVVITDDLESPTGTTTAKAAVGADVAGADIILISSTEAGGITAYNALLGAAHDGELPRARIRAAYGRILQLKQKYAS
jgi:beta-N-acetylhexosaminidase